MDVLVAEWAKSVETEDWHKFDRIKERVQALILTAAITRNFEQASGFADLLRATAAKIGSQSNVKRGAEQAFWSVLSDSQVASLAASLNAQMAEVAPRSSEAKLLLALLSAKENCLTNRELSSRAGLAEETVARVLPSLRKSELVVSWREGRSKANQLTEAGLSAAERLAREVPASDEPPQEVLLIDTDVKGWRPVFHVGMDEYVATSPRMFLGSEEPLSFLVFEERKNRREMRIPHRHHPGGNSQYTLSERQLMRIGAAEDKYLVGSN